MNRAPTISCAGAPTTGVVGVLYSFTPASSDPDGDTLTYSIRNPPPWERYTFVTSSGNLSGRPRTVRSHSGIEITATDPGGLSAMCRLPTITVSAAPVEPPPPPPVEPPPVARTATVRWTPPTQNSDGSALTDLAGYRISYGQASNAMTQTVNVPTAGVNSQVVSIPSAGTWYFVVTAVNVAGVESAESAVASRAYP